MDRVMAWCPRRSAAASQAVTSRFGLEGAKPKGARKPAASGHALLISVRTASNSSLSAAKLSTSVDSVACCKGRRGSLPSASSSARASTWSCCSSSWRTARCCWRSRRRATSTEPRLACRRSDWACSASHCLVRALTFHKRSVLSSSVVNFRSSVFSSLSCCTSARRDLSSLSCILMRSLKCSATSSAMPAAGEPAPPPPRSSQMRTMASWISWKRLAAAAAKPMG
mmetsp:Transcript_92832/g.220712  ORF Transcript_92832/g.220712 Transcript_92832/m.220712 type:complete len:226 (+) Transcript_92832:1-678(+)